MLKKYINFYYIKAPKFRLLGYKGSLFAMQNGKKQLPLGYLRLLGGKMKYYDIFKEYEKRKIELRQQRLTEKEYEQAMKRLAKEWGIQG